MEPLEVDPASLRDRVSRKNEQRLILCSWEAIFMRKMTLGGSTLDSQQGKQD